MLLRGYSIHFSSIHSFIYSFVQALEIQQTKKAILTFFKSWLTQAWASVQLSKAPKLLSTVMINNCTISYSAPDSEGFQWALRSDSSSTRDIFFSFHGHENNQRCAPLYRCAILVINFSQTYQNPRREAKLKHKQNLWWKVNVKSS